MGNFFQIALGKIMGTKNERELKRLIPRVGDPLYSSDRRPLLTLVADTSPGIHDTLMASCDAAIKWGRRTVHVYVLDH